ncbi:TonB-dependent receptor [Aurantibacter crassamenti]|uniref:carboxypeptidase-like regulatory domain-containing protein n=1 Tax=Aurantibacter crassamenti TaxID=1837375 RepID=UPI00193A9507|nr:carboxypeptidase-like regulatory domain-containing protein [Aurantibacter crassamenti]MBM1104894.1 TonB-dependent receptor [Aurantibacter crassamenti]
MRLTLAVLLLAFSTSTLKAQRTFLIKGKVLDSHLKEPIISVYISISGTKFSCQSTISGDFELHVLTKGEFILNISSIDYVVKHIPVIVADDVVDIGVVYLEKDLVQERTDNLISLTESELFDEEADSNSSALLQATRDVFLTRAAFDFGQAFFRVKGYDSREGEVLINGISMNKLFDGRPQWNNWGGLNDVTRNQQFSNALQPSDFTFGGILGNTNIDMRPSGFRPGSRISTSFSNRTYTGRLMATYSSGLLKNGLTYSVSGSRRWAKQGYINGTLYDAFSFFGGLEYEFNEKNSVNFTGILASNRRGRSSAITEEVYEMVGNKYNPYWGEQNGKIRNSRERKIAEPILMLNHYYTSDKLNVTSGISYQFGEISKGRLGYYNAPNPDPTYYRYLPSFYINSTIGANFVSANLAKQGFVENPQVDWPSMYAANSLPKAAYILYEDRVVDRQFSFSSNANLSLNDQFQIDFGGSYKNLHSENYAQIQDLLGADFHEDIDPFSNTLSDAIGEINKRKNEIFNYHFIYNVSRMNAFAQLKYNYKKWNAFVAATFSNTNYQREGLFKNERYPNNSLGKSEKLSFLNLGVKGGLNYKVNGRHWLTSNFHYANRPPILQNVFINPRENNQIVAEIKEETISAFDMNYFMRLPKLTGRFTGYYTRFDNTTDVNFFFVDAGVGSDFVQEVLTDLDKLHFGVELGLEYQISSAVKLTFVSAIGKFIYASNPSVSINFDTAGAEEDVINPTGNIDLGKAVIKDYRLAQGPQEAFAFGIEYRDPKYWWVSATTNYLAKNYANISTITRTPSFYINPETELPFIDATEENVNALLKQEPLDNFYLLNVVGGKSWLKKGKYISVFMSINNLFNQVFRTGGYEQSRNGNYGQLKQDNLSGTPSFAPKYWYGYGRTYFLNVAYSF